VTPLPDLLDRLGLAISEHGSVQVAVESPQLHWPSGEVRVAVLLQAAWSGELPVTLELEGGGARTRRAVQVGPGEVRRVRLSLQLPGGAQPLLLKVHAPIPAGATRVRSAWLKDAQPAEEASGSVVDTFWGAVRQALGQRAPRVEVRAPEQGEVPVVLRAVGRDAPIAAEQETVWQPGMADPDAAVPLQIAEVAPAMRTEARVSAQGERIQCPHCYALVYPEEVRVQLRCPSCDHAWAV
jgi:hypothetical protein